MPRATLKFLVGALAAVAAAASDVALAYAEVILKEFDSDRNGLVSYPELLRTAPKHAPPLTQGDFDELDLDRSGSLDLAELRQMLGRKEKDIADVEVADRASALAAVSATAGFEVLEGSKDFEEDSFGGVETELASDGVVNEESADMFVQWRSTDVRSHYTLDELDFLDGVAKSTMAQLDSDMDGRLALSELKAAAEQGMDMSIELAKFESLDADGDGALSLEELLGALYGEDRVEEAAGMALHNALGDLEKEEDLHLEMPAALTVEEREELHAFALETMMEHDLDRDGFLSLEELREDSALSPSQEALELQKFANADVNSDGLLSLAELQATALSMPLLFDEDESLEEDPDAEVKDVAEMEEEYSSAPGHA